jgi:hypothetical protein
MTKYDDAGNPLPLVIKSLGGNNWLNAKIALETGYTGCVAPVVCYAVTHSNF